MTNFSHYPPTFKWAKYLITNMFSEASCDQIMWSNKESYDYRFVIWYELICLCYDELSYYNSVKM